jgi:predicted N-acetyltransferase YhbS
MDVQLRPGSPEDASACGQICYEAFASIASAHSFPCDFPAPEAAVGLVSMMLSHPGFYSVVAETEGQVVGSNFLDERSAIAGVGPITVAPAFQDSSIGRQLMGAVMDRAAERGAPGVRLVQAAYHNRSLSLYSKLGFSAREPLACMQGPALRRSIEGHSVRPATAEDADACNRLCVAVHGHDRFGEVSDAIAQGTGLVVEHDGRITGYSTGLAFFAHSVGETTEDIKALIGAVDDFAGPGILVPVRNQQLFSFCLRAGLRVVQVMTLMTTGLYNEPAGGWLPSILY